MRPEVGRSIAAIQNASVLFPEPDSPTRARVFFGRIVSETPSTASKPSGCAAALDGLYRFTRDSTFRSGSAICMVQALLSTIFETCDCSIFFGGNNHWLALNALLHSFVAARLKSTSHDLRGHIR